MTRLSTPESRQQEKRPGPPALVDRIRTLNCARCRSEMLGESMLGYTRLGPYSGLPYVHAWLSDRERPAADHERPYCLDCSLIEVRLRAREK